MAGGSGYTQFYSDYFYYCWLSFLSDSLFWMLSCTTSATNSYRAQAGITKPVSRLGALKKKKKDLTGILVDPKRDFQL